MIHTDPPKDDSNTHEHELSQQDPWESPPYYLAKRKTGLTGVSRQQTRSGYWEEKEDSCIAIRSGGSSAAAAPSYLGWRRTLEFYKADGTKTDWFIHEYQCLRPRKGTGTFALLSFSFDEEHVVFRKVLNTGIPHKASVYCGFDKYLKAYKDFYSSDPSDQLISSLAKRQTWRDFNSFLHLEAIPADIHREASPADYRTSSELISSLANRQTWRDMKSFLHRGQFVSGQNQGGWRGLEEIKSPTSQNPPQPTSFTGINQRRPEAPNPDGKSSVWQHFTKICTEDPGVVYAACHRCDKMFNAHPKKHGISHLRRHSQTCSSCNPSTDEDRAILHHLREVLDRQQQADGKLQCEEMNVDLAQLDPNDLVLTCPTPWYVTSSFNRQTHGGVWKEMKEFTAIRKEQLQMQGSWKEITTIEMVDQLKMEGPPQYIGLRRTLEFHHQDGIKTDWIMLEYQQVDDKNSPSLFLQGGMVIRKVFHYDKDAVASTFEEVDRWLNADDENKEYYRGEGVSTETTTSSSDSMDSGVDRKRKRTGASCHKSKVWMHFSEIYNTDCAVMYVVCHTCDRGFTTGGSKTDLWRHNKSCVNKCPRTENPNDATTEWEAEIWPLFLLFKNYGETEHQGYTEARSQEDGPAA